MDNDRSQSETELAIRQRGEMVYRLTPKARGHIHEVCYHGALEAWDRERPSLEWDEWTCGHHHGPDAEAARECARAELARRQR